METLIQTINKLQDVFAVIEGEHHIDLPQIVVVGSQSSGKSSVLESLVGKSFLPRGTGIVTRVPLLLHIKRYTKEDRESMLKITNNETIETWAEFPHKPGTIFDNFEEVRREIELQTDVLAGTNKGISNKPIILNVYTLLYDLTLIDLPGITKIPIGDQPKDIEKQIQALIKTYVEQPNSIILAMITANTDSSTCESLKVAHQMDPEGARTIAVVTKLDLIDEGTLQDATDLLCGRKIPVKLGIIGVVNRSQKDINDNKTMEEALKSERAFFKANYPDIYEKHGNQVLANTLQKILGSHIRKTIPILKKNLYNTKARLKKELSILQVPDCNVSFILGLLNDINKSYCDTILGNRKCVSDNAVTGGARISEIITKKYVDGLNKIDPLLNLSDERIGYILLNTAGSKNSTLINEKALEQLIDKQLKNLIEPSLSIVDLVRDEMLEIFNNIDQRILVTLERFPRVDADVRSILNNMLNANLAEIKEFVKSYIETHQTCLNTTNPDFIFHLVKSSPQMQEAYLATHLNNRVLRNGCEYKDTSFEALKREEEGRLQLFKQMLSGLDDLDKTMKTSKQVKLHRDVTYYYFEFIRNNIRDFVPKRIQHKMIKFILENFGNHLMKYVFAPYNQQSFDGVFSEENGVAEKRQDAERLLAAVNKALAIIVDM